MECFGYLWGSCVCCSKFILGRMFVQFYDVPSSTACAFYICPERHLSLIKWQSIILGLGTWATFQGKKNGPDISMISLVLGEPAPTTMGKTLTFLGLFLNNINTSVACAFAPHVNLLPNFFFSFSNHFL